ARGEGGNRARNRGPRNWSYRAPARACAQSPLYPSPNHGMRPSSRASAGGENVCFVTPPAALFDGGRILLRDRARKGWPRGVFFRVFVVQLKPRGVGPPPYRLDKSPGTPLKRAWERSKVGSPGRTAIHELRCVFRRCPCPAQGRAPLPGFCRSRTARRPLPARDMACPTRAARRDRVVLQ